MPVHIKLSYRDRDNEPIPSPEDYPSELIIPHISNPLLVEEMDVKCIVNAEVMARGGQFRDVKIRWTPTTFSWVH